MHELIGAIVYAENEKEALIRARNAFSRLVTFDVMDGQTVCTSRFDYFMMFDTQTAFDFAKSVSNFFKNGFYMTRKSYDKNGDIIWEKKDFDRSFDYSKSLIRHWKFKPVGEESPRFLPPLFPISDPNAEHLLQRAHRSWIRTLPPVEISPVSFPFFFPNAYAKSIYILNRIQVHGKNSLLLFLIPQTREPCSRKILG